MKRLLTGALALLCVASFASADSEPGSDFQEPSFQYSCTFRKTQKGALIAEKKISFTAVSGSCSISDEMLLDIFTASSQACTSEGHEELGLFIYAEDAARPQAAFTVDTLARKGKASLDFAGATYVVECSRP